MGKRPVEEETSSESDDNLCSRAELEAALKGKKMWKQRALQLEKQNKAILELSASQQKCLEAKIFKSE